MGCLKLTYRNKPELRVSWSKNALASDKSVLKGRRCLGDRNHRIRKESYVNGSLQSTTHYVRDVAGQVLAIYDDRDGSMDLTELPIYGAGRIGVAYNDNSNDKDYIYSIVDNLGNVRALFTKYGNGARLEGASDYYPMGQKMGGRTLADAQKFRYGYQGEFAEEDDETGLNAFELRLYDARIGRWMAPDPYGQYHSPYLSMGNSWANTVDPDGGKDCACSGGGGSGFRMPLDDYFIRLDGTIDVRRTDDDFDTFSIENSEGGFDFIGKFNKNENSLIQLPSSFSSETSDSSFAFRVKEGNENRSFISGESFSALIGALSQEGIKDLTIIGFSLSDGSSPAPSKSHVNGRNGDLRYLRSDLSGDALYINQNPELLDESRQNSFNSALRKFGYKDLIGFEYKTFGSIRLLNHTRHLKNHHHHLHLQGFKPKLNLLNK